MTRTARTRHKIRMSMDDEAKAHELALRRVTQDAERRICQCIQVEEPFPIGMRSFGYCFQYHHTSEFHAAFGYHLFFPPKVRCSARRKPGMSKVFSP